MNDGGGQNFSVASGEANDIRAFVEAAARSNVTLYVVHTGPHKRWPPVMTTDSPRRQRSSM
jgi:hypothetical protein